MDMYEITIIKSFSAAHRLADIGGKCEELHGHNFKVEVSVASPELDQAGILIDFRIIKRWLSEILNNLDHKELNELTFFNKTNPSSENVAKYIYREMMLRTNNINLKISRVKVWESENAAVTYTAD
jgi:6-pyruvoyltetrahydropterin/6-carboxytetrahydropterin synthase